MNWKKLQALYEDALRTGDKEKAFVYIDLVLDVLRQRKCSVLDFSGGRA